VPWSEDATGEFLITPSRTRELLSAAGFVFAYVGHPRELADMVRPFLRSVFG
jgi:hypothetical protein